MLKNGGQKSYRACRPVIAYPCTWQYKIIGTSRLPIEEYVASIMTGKPYILEESNVSRTGRYISMNLELTVRDEHQRLEIYKALAAGREIKVVL